MGNEDRSFSSSLNTVFRTRGRSLADIFTHGSLVPKILGTGRSGDDIEGVSISALKIPKDLPMEE